MCGGSLSYDCHLYIEVVFVSIKNIQTEINGNTLILKIDLSLIYGRTKSLKSIMIATTAGCVPVGEGRDEKITVTVYKPIKKKDGESI